MSARLAYADNSDTSAMNLQVVMICLGIFLAAAVIAFVPVCITWHRRHRQTDAITLLAILWGCLATASVAHATLARIDYTREWNRRIESGYYDPQDVSDAPATPWKTWAALGAVYCGLIFWSVGQKNERALPAAEEPPPGANGV